MNLSSREAVLTGLTLAAILIGLSIWIGEPMFKEIKEQSTIRQNLEQQMSISQRLLDQKDAINERFGKLRKQMPKYPLDLDVTSQLLKTLQRAADAHGLILVRQEPAKEKQVGELYELAIRCSWEGTLDALVHFLFALQEQGAMVDIRQLRITPAKRAQGNLKGAFAVDYAYTRKASEPAPSSS